MTKPQQQGTSHGYVKKDQNNKQESTSAVDRNSKRRNMEQLDKEIELDKATKREPPQNEMVESIPLEDTPFTAIRMDDKWFLTLGKYRLSEPVKTFDEVTENAKDASWMRIMQIMRIMIAEHEAGRGQKI